jgi:hypothetical protein
MERSEHLIPHPHMWSSSFGDRHPDCWFVDDIHFRFQMCNVEDRHTRLPNRYFERAVDDDIHFRLQMCNVEDRHTRLPNRYFEHAVDDDIHFRLQMCNVEDCHIRLLDRCIVDSIHPL